MQLRQDEGAERKAAAQWVVDHASVELLRRISPNPQYVTWRTVAGWRDKYNTPLRDPGAANYQWIVARGREAKTNGKPNPAKGLLAIIEANFGDRLPALT
jgi:hypothetical protein